MASINSLKGKIVKDGRIVYSEKLENGLYLNVIIKYTPFYDGKNCNYYQSSSELTIETLISNNNYQNYSNGAISLNDVIEYQITDEKGNFSKLEKEFKTKDGYRVWQKDYNYQESTMEVDGNKIKTKTRNVVWLVEIPKLDLIKYIK